MAVAEYVLGTLDAAERTAFLRAATADPRLQAEAAGWAVRLNRLAEDIEPVAPSPATWAAIAARTGGRPASNVVDFPRRRATARVLPWRLGLGAAGAIAAGLAVFVIAGDFFKPQPTGVTQTAQIETTQVQTPIAPKEPASPPDTTSAKSDIVVAPSAAPAPVQTQVAQSAPAPKAAVAEPQRASEPAGSVSIANARPGTGSVSIANATRDGDQGPRLSTGGDQITAPPSRRDTVGPRTYVAVLKQGDQAEMTLRIDGTARSLLVQAPASAVPPGKSLQLWYAAADGSLHSLGLIQGSGLTELALPGDMSLDQARIQASIEPSGGSPTGRPTGALIYQGQVTAQ